MMIRPSLEPMTQRGTAANRRPFHDNKADALQMAHNSLGGNRSHVFIGVVTARNPRGADY
jgi:hypothetical protein